MMRCQLVRREERGRGGGTVVALHADGADARELWPATLALGRDAVAPQAPRGRDPFHAGAGHSWFRRDDAGRPEPASFGDSLAQLESLVAELERPVFLVGHREGATLALGAALAFPERLAGVIALDGPRPEIPGWSDSLAFPPDLPVFELGAESWPTTPRS
jgi:pimeloyl-ACP methyl ester carboxylesterase